MGTELRGRVSGWYVGADRELHSCGNAAGLPSRISAPRSGADGFYSHLGIAGSCRDLDALGRIGAAAGDGVGRDSLRGRGSRLRVILCKTELGRLGKRTEFLW